MITNDAEFTVAVEQLGRANRALESLRASVFPKSPANFAVMAESYLHTRDLVVAGIDAYLAEREPAVRGGLLRVIVQALPWVSEQTAGRLAGIRHLHQVTGDAGFPGGAGSLVRMFVDALETEVQGMCGPDQPSEPASASAG